MLSFSTSRPSPCIHEAHFRHRGASVSGFLRPSATVAAWHPGPALPFRGKASACLGCISLPPACVATASRRLRPLVFARRHPRPGNGGDAAGLLPPPRQPAAARVARDSLCLPPFAAVPNQAGLLQTNIAAISIGVNRLPSSFALLGRGFTMPAVCANACHRPSIQRGSRLGFYRSPVTAMSSSHRLFVARFRSLPGETRLASGFCQYTGPSDNRRYAK